MTSVRIVEEYRQVPAGAIAGASIAELSYTEQAASIPIAIARRHTRTMAAMHDVYEQNKRIRDLEDRVLALERLLAQLVKKPSR